MDTTYFPIGELTASIIWSFFLRLDPWNCFFTSTCHLRQSLIFLSEIASLDNITRQLLSHTIDFTQLCPQKAFPPTSSFSFKDVQDGSQDPSHKPHTIYSLSDSPDGILHWLIPLQNSSEFAQTQSLICVPNSTPNCPSWSKITSVKTLATLVLSSALLSTGKALKYHWRNQWEAKFGRMANKEACTKGFIPLSSMHLGRTNWPSQKWQNACWECQNCWRKCSFAFQNSSPTREQTTHYMSSIIQHYQMNLWPTGSVGQF